MAEIRPVGQMSNPELIMVLGAKVVQLESAHMRMAEMESKMSELEEENQVLRAQGDFRIVQPIEVPPPVSTEPAARAAGE